MSLAPASSRGASSDRSIAHPVCQRRPIELYPKHRPPLETTQPGWGIRRRTEEAIAGRRSAAMRLAGAHRATLCWNIVSSGGVDDVTCVAIRTYCGLGPFG